MKARDFVIFGSNATAAVTLGSEEAITWEFNNLTFYEVDQGEAVELVELGIHQDYAVERCFVRNKDNMEWFQDGFITLGGSIGHNCTELPYGRRPDFTKILAPITPDSVNRAAPTLKLPQGDYLRLIKRNSSTGEGLSASRTQAVAILRKYVAETPAEQLQVQNYDKQFGGLNSGAQLWHENGSLSTGVAATWTDVIDMTILKAELYAFNKIGMWFAPGMAAGEADKMRIFIDEQMEYNKYPLPALAISPIAGGTEGDGVGQNMFPFNDGFYQISSGAIDPQLVARADYYIPNMYIFDKPLVVSRQYNKRMQLQWWSTVALATSNVPNYARMTGMRYRIGS